MMTSLTLGYFAGRKPSETIFDNQPAATTPGGAAVPKQDAAPPTAAPVPAQPAAPSQTNPPAKSQTP
jgi:hypothetical protein